MRVGPGRIKFQVQVIPVEEVISSDFHLLSLEVKQINPVSNPNPRLYMSHHH
jgi:hypothetical protein